MRREPSEHKTLKLFGETEDPTEAGWILPSGKLARWTDTHEIMASQINGCSKDNIIHQGWIRVVNNSEINEAGINISADVKLTIPQLRRVQELVEQADIDHFIIEWTSKDGKHLSKELPPMPEEVLFCLGAMYTVGFEQVYQDYKSKQEKGETK